jgi:DNA-binding transcriptional LysR family regulator
MCIQLFGYTVAASNEAGTIRMNESSKQVYYKQNRLQQLRGFCHVVQTGSISKAAERMTLSQPSVSLQIQALERELTVVLFERNGPHLKITPEGNSLYTLARPLVDGMDNLYETFVERHTDTNSGKLKIAVDSVVSHGLLTKVLSRFVGQYPGVKVEISTNDMEVSREALRSDEVDLVVTVDYSASDGMIFSSLREYEMVLVTSREHPFERQSKISLEEISQQPLVVATDFQEASKISIEQVFRSHRLPYNVKLALGSVDQLKNAVIENIGVGILPSICLQLDEPFSVFDVSSYFSSQACGYLVRKGRFITPQAKNFIDILVSEVKNKPFQVEGGRLFPVDKKNSVEAEVV